VPAWRCFVDDARAVGERGGIVLVGALGRIGMGVLERGVEVDEDSGDGFDSGGLLLAGW
jgi:hypothetical protein